MQKQYWWSETRNEQLSMSLIHEATRISEKETKWGFSKPEVDQCNPKSLNGKSLKCSLWNVTTMVHKTEKIMEYIVEHDSDD